MNNNTSRLDMVGSSEVNIGSSTSMARCKYVTQTQTATKTTSFQFYVLTSSISFTNHNQIVAIPISGLGLGNNVNLSVKASVTWSVPSTFNISGCNVSRKDLSTQLAMYSGTTALVGGSSVNMGTENSATLSSSRFSYSDGDRSYLIYEYCHMAHYFNSMWFSRWSYRSIA